MHGKRGYFALIAAEVLLATLLAIALPTATTHVPAAWQRYLWIAWPALGALVLAGPVLTVWRHRLDSGPSTVPVHVSEERRLRSRSWMLKRVHSIWIEGLLEQSLDRIARIDLGLEKRPEAVAHPWDALVQEAERLPRVLSTGTSVTEVFEESGESLLILGAPGAGKTTTMLELARDRLARAEQDEALPIPVVFHLASWAGRRQPLVDWLVDELVSDRYKVPRDVAQAWVAAEQVLLLLDGLDEVALEYRAECAAAINDFHREHGPVPLVVCSRVADYEALGVQLQLQTAISIQPLTRAQVDRYLVQLGEPLEGVRAALREDPTLWSLLQTPLLLSVTVLAYQGTPLAALPSAGTISERRAQLFAAYVDRMFRRRGAHDPYTKHQAVRRLSYMARALGRGWRTVFYLESVTTKWLPTGRQRGLVIVAKAAPAALLAGFAGGGAMWLLFGSLVGVPTGIVCGLLAGSAAKSAGEGLLGLAEPTRLGQLVEALVDHCVPGVMLGLVLALIGTVILGLAGISVGALVGLLGDDTVGHAAIRGALIGLAEALLFGIFLGSGIAGSELVGGSGAFDFRVSGSHAERPSSSVGTRVGVYLAVCLGAIAAVIVGVPFGLAFGMRSGLLVGGLTGAAYGYWVGGMWFLSYWVTRLILARDRLAPLKYVAFLDFAASRVLLYKIGGGYIFIHRLLLEHFARLELEDVDEHRWKGGLAAADLRPEMVIEQAFELAERGDASGALAAFRWAVDSGELEDAPAAAVRVGELLGKVVLSRAESAPGPMVEFDAQGLHVIAEGARVAYQWAIDSGHAEFAPAAAFRLGELLTQQAKIEAAAEEFMHRGARNHNRLRADAAKAYQVAVNSGHARYGPAAARSLENLSSTSNADKLPTKAPEDPK